MIFADLPAGAAVFIDANPLVYHYTSHAQFGTQCSALLARIERQEIIGFASTHALGEVAHRMMTFEAITSLGWLPANIGNRLRANPAEVNKLSAFRKAIDGLLQSRLRILTVDPPLLSTAAALSQQFGLLTNDGLIVAIMQANGLTHLASVDADFDRVPWLVRVAPG